MTKIHIAFSNWKVDNNKIVNYLEFVEYWKKLQRISLKMMSWTLCNSSFDIV